MPDLFKYKSECFGCEACAAACPQKAIVMESDEEGFAYPRVREKSCMECGRCEEVCPQRRPLGKTAIRAYAVRDRDPETLCRSTSGGAFSLIASSILNEGGLVCGAVFDGDFRVVHVLSDDIRPMRKAKYIQSRIGNCFCEMESALQAGKKVLFSGTPCQCHGVKLLFGDHPSLLLVSVVCRGVQSPAVWEEYTRWLEKDGKLSDYCFRDKKRRDDAHTVSCTVGGIKRETFFLDDPFTRLQMKNIPYRPSCYRCPYCYPERELDFSLGDFWGIGKCFPEFADGKGTSLVIAGSEKAGLILEEIRSCALVREADREQILQDALHSPAKEPFLRRFFFKDFRMKGMDGSCDMGYLLKKYGS